MDEQAKTLKEVWGNFRPDKVLEPDSPFRIERHDYRTQVPLRRIQKSDPDEYEKWFLVGHRGCGKSTFSRHLLSLAEVKEKYHPLAFQISAVADMADLSYQDVLFATASKLIEEAEKLKAIQAKLKTRLESWGQTLVRETTKQESASAEVEGGLNAVWAKFLLKLQVQHATRQQFRKVIEPQVSELINIIDEVAEALRQELKKPPLVAIDDMDKARESFAREFFGDNWNNVIRPKCHMIYSVPVSLMHESAWNNLRDRSWYLPNIKLYEKNSRNKKNRKPNDGYKLMTKFIRQRMDLSLISKSALEDVITYGAGVFRQTCSIMQLAADRAEYRNQSKIEKENVRAAVAEYADGLRPQLLTEDFEVLRQVSQDNGSQTIYEHPKLLHNLAVLLYPNEHHWHDVNPVLWEILDASEATNSATG